MIYLHFILLLLLFKVIPIVGYETIFESSQIAAVAGKKNKIHSQMTFIPRSRYDTYSGWEFTITPLGRLMPITEFHCENRLPTDWHTRLLLLPRDLIVKYYYKHNLYSTCIRQLI